ncbi:MAG: hypothetical protein LC101_12720 [Flavobacteriales bacterium]|nr:hypothetical protein [Flavobacteriales bacterium]
MKLHHLGFVVSHVDHISFGIPAKILLKEVIDPIQDASIYIYSVGSDCLVEFIVPLSSASTVYGFLQKHEEGFHHLCFSCTEEEMNNHVSAHRMIRVMGPVPAIVFDNKIVYFYLGRDGRLTEFILE